MELPLATLSLVRKAAAILREEGASEVFVFGSHARGTARPDSDLDLAVAGLPIDRVVIAMKRLLSETGCLSDLLLVEREPTFVQYLTSKGELQRVA